MAMSFNLSRAYQVRRVDGSGTFDSVQTVTFLIFTNRRIDWCEITSLAVPNEVIV